MNVTEINLRKMTKEDVIELADYLEEKDLNIMHISMDDSYCKEPGMHLTHSCSTAEPEIPYSSQIFWGYVSKNYPTNDFVVDETMISKDEFIEEFYKFITGEYQ